MSLHIQIHSRLLPRLPFFLACLAFACLDPSDHRIVASASPVEHENTAAPAGRQPPNFIWQLTFHPDGKRLFSVARDEVLRVWDTTQGKESTKKEDLSFTSVSAFSLSGDGRTLAYCKKQKLYLFDLVKSINLWWSGEEAHSTHTPVLTPKGDFVVTEASDKHFLQVWDVTSGKKVRLLGEHKYGVCDWTVSSDGKYLASTDHGFGIYIWDLKSGNSLSRDDFMRDSCSSPLVFAPDGQRLVIGKGEDVSVWEIKGKKVVTQFASHQGKGTVFGVGFSADNQTVASGSTKGPTYLWEAKTGKIKHTLPVPGSTCLAISPDGSKIAIGSMGIIYLFDATSGKELFQLSSS